MIKVQNLTKKFGQKVAVNDISFDVKPGEIFGFLGPNGAGKTTTIKMIVGLLEPDQGHITVSGVDVVKDSLESKKKFAYVPDNPDIYENLTGYQYLNFIANIYDVSEQDRKARIEKYSRLFEIEGDLNDYLKGFSHGMKQKVALIGALVSDPDVLILDEPMVGLDPKSAFNLKEVMRERCDLGKSVFFSTHVMEVAEKICDRISIIKSGDIIAYGTIDELRQRAHSSESLEQLFLELTE
ncbi:MAG: ABC transporter ATP-binding protein [Tissierellia bacterium]|nr:ABC transporter ATP-binding protein [Tissierellia bacterium]